MYLSYFPAKEHALSDFDQFLLWYENFCHGKNHNLRMELGSGGEGVGVQGVKLIKS